MRILHFLTNSSIGGGQAAVASLIDVIRQMDDNAAVGVVLPEGGPYVDRFRSAGYETITLPLSSYHLPASSVRQVIRRFVPNVVHSHGKGAGFHVRRSIGTSSGMAVVHNFHGFHPPQRFPLRQLYIELENTLARRCHKLVCVSESEANEVHRSLNNARGKIEVVQNCIDKAKTVRDSKDPLPSALESWFGRQDGRKVVTMVARPDPVKNHDLACQAIDAVLRASTRYAFLFVGLPPTDRRFARLRKRHGDRVYAVDGLPSAAPAVRRSWMVFLPSRKEGSPLIILEGFALGVPTIGTRVPGIVDTLQDSWNGFLMDPVPEGLLHVLTKIERSPDLYEAARSGAKEQGSYLRMRAWARQYLDIYRTAAATA